MALNHLWSFEITNTIQFLHVDVVLYVASIFSVVFLKNCRLDVSLFSVVSSFFLVSILFTFNCYPVVYHEFNMSTTRLSFSMSFFGAS